MKGGKYGNNSIGGLMAFLILGLFAVCILTVLLLGAETYESLSRRNQQGFEERTCVQHLATRVRQAESGSGITVDQVGGLDVLVLTETIEGESYRTWIYCYDGWLREYFTEADLEKPEPELGEPVLELESMNLSLEDGLLTAVLTSGGACRELVLSLRSGETAGKAG